MRMEMTIILFINFLMIWIGDIVCIYNKKDIPRWITKVFDYGMVAAMFLEFGYYLGTYINYIKH